MNLAELKAWLEGFCDGMGNAPTPKEWEKIKAKIAETQAITVPNVVSPYVSSPATVTTNPFSLPNNLVPVGSRDWVPPDLGTRTYSANADRSRFEPVVPISN